MSAEQQESLRSIVVEKVEAETLNSAELSELLKLQETSQPESKRNWIVLRWLGSTAALLALGLAVMMQISSHSQRQVLQSIAAEVVENHIKLKPLDAQTNSIVELRRFFTHLDFLPLESEYFHERLAHNGSQLVGGRYCSIKGVTAAQLRFGAGASTMETLYQVPYDAKLFGEIPSLEEGNAPTKLSVSGLEVSIWVEKGLLLVAVQP